MRRLISGARAGLCATGPMTAWMLAAAVLPGHGELPPKRILRAAADRIGVSTGDGAGTWVATAAMHAAIGMGCGVGYALLVRRSTAARGTAYGTGVWAAAYGSGLPLLGLMPPPHHDQPARALATLTSHWVYGAALDHFS